MRSSKARDQFRLNELVTVEELAARLRVSVKTVRS